MYETSRLGSEARIPKKEYTFFFYAEEESQLFFAIDQF